MSHGRPGLRGDGPGRQRADRAAPTPAQRDLLGRYVEASHRADVAALTTLLHKDVSASMLPQPGVWRGRDRVVQSWVDGGFGSMGFGQLRCAVTHANGQPAVAAYLRRAGDDAFRPLALDVLTVAGDMVTDVTTFDGPLFALFGLPETL